MGIEHYYQVIDRSAVDSLLSLTWPQFLDRYGWKRDLQWPTAEDFLTEFALDDEKVVERVSRILARRNNEVRLTAFTHLESPIVARSQYNGRQQPILRSEILRVTPHGLIDREVSPPKASISLSALSGH